MRTIQINRKKWQRGQIIDNFLWNNKTCQGCILGHVIHKTQKCSWDELDFMTTPKEYFTRESILTNRCNEDYDDFFGCTYEIDNTLFAEKAMEINDDTVIDDETREKILTQLFKENGYNLKFYN